MSSFDPTGILSGVLGGLGSLASSQISAQAQQQTNMMNMQMFQQQFGFEQEQYKYMKQQNELTRAREDNALQRRIQDARLAGIHPTIAAGGQAQAQAPALANFGTPAPHLQHKGVDYGAAIQNALQAKLLASQIREVDSRANLNNTQADDIKPAAADRRTSINDLRQYHSDLIEGARDDRTLRESLAAASNALTARGLSNEDRRIANDTVRLSIEQSMVAGRQDLVIAEIKNLTARSKLNDRERVAIEESAQNAIRDYNRHVGESDRSYSEDRRQFNVRTIVDIINHLARLVSNLF